MAVADKPRRLLLAASTATAVAVLAGWLLVWRTSTPTGSMLVAIQDAGELVVLTRNAPTTYYEDRDGLAGPEFDLTQSFARSLGVQVRYELKDSVAALLEALRRGEGHLVAAGITRTEARETEFLFGPTYQSIQQKVVYRRGSERPREPADLVGRSLAVIGGSSYVETLESWRLDLPDLRWDSADDNGSEQYLEAVSEGRLDCTIVDSNILAINRRYIPDLAEAFPASELQSLAWAMRPGAEDLVAAMEDWLEAAEGGGELAEIMERYYGHVELFDYVDLRAFRRRIESRLPRYRALFERAAADHEVPWTLLAAQAYQESHWNPKAKSPTGVRGMMMLTQATAKAMGVKNRLDPAQSVAGGARYLRRMLGRLPDTVTGDDRLWYALAAYNVGFGHLQDARLLAQRLGRNPDAWHELSQVLPLLAKKQYYRDLRHGYARGSEPVQYVQRIRNYRQILEFRTGSAGGDGRSRAAEPAG